MRTLSLIILILSIQACTKLKNDVEALELRCGAVDTTESYIQFTRSNGTRLSSDDIASVTAVHDGSDLKSKLSPKGCLASSSFPEQELKIVTSDRKEAGFYLAPDTRLKYSELPLHPIAPLSILAKNCGTPRNNMNAYAIELESRASLNGVRLIQRPLNRNNEPVGSPSVTTILDHETRVELPVPTPSADQPYHQLMITAEDLAGQIYSLDQPCVIAFDATPPRLTLDIPSLAPSLSLLQGPLVVNTSEAALVYYRFQEEGQADACACGNESCGYRVLSQQPILWDEGRHQLMVCAVDSAGNVSETFTQSILVDRSPPVVNISWDGATPDSPAFAIRRQFHDQFTARLNAHDNLEFELLCRVGLLGQQNQWIALPETICESESCKGQSLSSFTPCQNTLSFRLGDTSFMELSGHVLAVEAKAQDNAGHTTTARATVLLDWQLGPRTTLSGITRPNQDIFEIDSTENFQSGTTRTHSWMAFGQQIFVFDGLEWTAAGPLPQDLSHFSDKGAGLFQFRRDGQLLQYQDKTWKTLPLPLGESKIMDLYHHESSTYLLGEKKLWKLENGVYEDFTLPNQEALGLAFDEKDLTLIHTQGILNLTSSEIKTFPITRFWQSRQLGFFLQTPQALLHWRQGRLQSQIEIKEGSQAVMAYDYGKQVIFLADGQQILFHETVQAFPSRIETPLNNQLIGPAGEEIHERSPSENAIDILRPHQPPQTIRGYKPGWIHQLIASDAGQLYFLGVEFKTVTSGDAHASIPTVGAFGEISTDQGLKKLGRLARLFRDHQGRVWGLDRDGLVLIDAMATRPFRLAGRAVQYVDELPSGLVASFADGIQTLDRSGTSFYSVINSLNSAGSMDPETQQIWAATQDLMKTWNHDRWIDQAMELAVPDSRRIYQAEDHSRWVTTRPSGGGSIHRFHPPTARWMIEAPTAYTKAIFRDHEVALFASSFNTGEVLQKPTALGLETIADGSLFMMDEAGTLTTSTSRRYKFLGQLGRQLLFQITDREGQSYLGCYGDSWQEHQLKNGIKFHATPAGIFYEHDTEIGKLVLHDSGSPVFQAYSKAQVPPGPIRSIFPWNGTGLAVFHQNGQLYLMSETGLLESIPFQGYPRHFTSLAGGGILFNDQDSWYLLDGERKLSRIASLPDFNSYDLTAFSCQDEALFFHRTRGSMLRISKDAYSTIRFDTQGLAQDPLEIRRGGDGRIWALSSTSVHVTHCPI